MGTPVVIGAGLAGLSFALTMAPCPVVVIGRKPDTAMTSSELAQGGIAAAVGRGDQPRFHAQDTMAAGAGLCDPKIVEMITAVAPLAIENLCMWGVAFDRDENYELHCGLEGAHHRRRVVHAQGDQTGAAVMQALLAKVRKASHITFLEDAQAQEILSKDGAVYGVVFSSPASGQPQFIATDHVLLATGGVGALWRYTTVPLGSWGHGLFLAARAGARLRDMEFVQFHPTALNVGVDPMPLVSEAVRGEGGKLVDKEGKSFVDELSPRDVVARAIWAQTQSGQEVFLDARKIRDFRGHFPGVYQSCKNHNINPHDDLIPVRPVAHYHMGGVATDEKGQSNVRGLWACGECACTGLHGANRLASNSLLEAVVMGVRIAEAIKPAAPRDKDWRIENYPAAPLGPTETTEEILRIRKLMVADVGLIRDARGLTHAITRLEEIAQISPRACVGLMVAKAALAREESRGAHARSDFSEMRKELAKSSFVRLQDGQVVIEGVGIRGSGLGIN